MRLPVWVWNMTYYDDKASLRAAARRGQYKTNKPIGPPKKKVKQEYVKPPDNDLPRRHKTTFKALERDPYEFMKLALAGR